MEIVVVGAGSVGMLVASFLSEHNENVTLVPNREEQKRKLQQHGLVRENLDGTKTVSKVNISMDFSKASKDSIVIIAVKYGQLPRIYEILRTLNPDTSLLFLQNGLAHLEEAKTLPQQSIAFGSCQFGAERKNDTIVYHRGAGVLKIAVEKGVARPFTILGQGKGELFQVKFVENAEQMLLEKAILNSLINPLTAILQVVNGVLVENSQAHLLLEKVYNELMAAFPEQAAHISFADVENLCERTSANTSSMLGDILHARPTEIKTIVGEILKRATQRGKSLPILETLYLLVLAKEESGEKR